MRTAYLAPRGFEKELVQELGEVREQHGRLMVVEGAPRGVAWVQNIWYDPVEIPIASIGDAAKKLRAIQRNWVCYSHDFHRRTALIQEKLPHISAKPLVFPSPLPKGQLGAWTLIKPDLILAAARTSSPFPNGEVHFVENKTDPPNRAYLKLWEVFTLLQTYPKPGEICLDLGSAPGGWTWVMASLGSKVISVDKAPLESRITAMPNIEYRQESAFALQPETIGKVDWLCADIACYPERLLTLVERWLVSGLYHNCICTLKFQGETDHAVAARFKSIPGSQLMHLFHNKHELTWVRLAD